METPTITLGARLGIVRPQGIYYLTETPTNSFGGSSRDSVALRHILYYFIVTPTNTLEARLGILKAYTVLYSKE
jgi:hypothetical protein